MTENEKNSIIIPKKPRLEKNSGRNRKGKKILSNIPACNSTELNELISAGAKLVCDKISVS